MDKALAFKDRILNKENLNPKTWIKAENIKGFKDFILQKESEETDGQNFDDENMLLDSEKAYMEAAKKNDVHTMKLLGKSVNVNAKNVHDRTALHYAVAGKNQEAVELLLQRRAKLDVQDKHGVTAAHLAAWFGSLAILKLLIQAGADQKTENQEGMTIMHCAAINNHTDIVTYIVNDLQMKELDKEDQSGKRAFSRAAEHGCVPMMELLLEEPFSMATMQEDQNGNTPLHLAAKNGHLNAIQLLLQNFDNRNEVNKAGETSLYLAANGAYEDCVQALLEADCDPNIVTTAKNAALHPVAEKGYTSLVKLLTDNGADMNLQNQHLQAPFHLAVKNCHIPVIHTLLKAGCDTDVTDHRGQTALHIAAELGKTDVVEMILKADTDLSLRDKQEKTPLGVAARGNMVIIVDMIIKAERYFAWKKANVEFNETLHNDFPLTFKLDHSAETKQIRATIWNLGYHLLKPNDWKKLAQHWDFTGPQIAAIEEQWTGLKSYQEHGNRMMLIWLHGVCMTGKNATKELHESLLSTGYTSIADKIRADTNGKETRKCSVS
ncbi:ankyrin repeat and death domain-containing protein 1B isoform X1 [Brienomyrus brachyistius]|uniref:ankyrin repeat and death domain-containing protein 1B isoform X1 n=1 Tax=Brienomyrus brachyistius TaxID=42636 RepID=UPI0020B3AA7E|nr:ankyrin repeat and death domain-containing protein 1B isoform X1 [Brienomyrus brachyistius]